MSTKLILIRHGQSCANLTHTFGGQDDLPLTDLGRTQADCAKEYLMNTHIDAVYASDLIRAFETAERIAEPHDLPVIPEKNLREIYAGEWEGVPFDELPERYPEDFGLWLSDIGLSHPTGGESVAELQARIRGALEEIIAKHPGETVLIGTHATSIRVMMCHWMGKPLSEMKNIPWVPNASITTILYEPDLTFHDLCAGQTEHLGDLKTELPKNV
ncbi:MAG: histidine phosphatase family protein [Clostridia bacterium]|nr:histidine phosphatase family protein [Clostridia bacterium]